MNIRSIGCPADKRVGDIGCAASKGQEDARKGESLEAVQIVAALAAAETLVDG
jgi:hypothetical protein